MPPNNKARATVLHSPPPQWRVEAGPGDSATLDAQATILKIDYRLAIARERLQGHMTVREGEFKLLLNTPVQLSPKVHAIRFEATGFTSPTRRGLNTIHLCPLLKDSRGKLLRYVPKAGAHLQSGGTGWSEWETNDFYSGEAGGAAQNIYSAEGGDGNAALSSS